jgi:Fe2+ transport system protein FeoA
MSVSLLDVPAGEKVRIRTILFDLLRHECEAIGLGVGQLVHVRNRSAAELQVELSQGRAVALRRQWAPFIEVEPSLS